MATKDITIESVATTAAAALDDRKSKLTFAKEVLKARSIEGSTDAAFAEVLRAARVLRVYPDATAEEIIVLGKDFEMSAAKVSNYGTALSQLQEAKAPVTEDTFGDWFKLVTKPGSAKLRKALIEEISVSEASQDGKAAVIKQAAKTFTRTPVVREPKALDLEAVLAFLERVADADFGSDAQAVSDALFEAGAAVADMVESDPIESEMVAA